MLLSVGRSVGTVRRSRSAPPSHDPRACESAGRRPGEAAAEGGGGRPLPTATAHPGRQPRRPPSAPTHGALSDDGWLLGGWIDTDAALTGDPRAAASLPGPQSQAEEGNDTPQLQDGHSLADSEDAADWDAVADVVRGWSGCDHWLSPRPTPQGHGSSASSHTGAAGGPHLPVAAIDRPAPPPRRLYCAVYQQGVHCLFPIVRAAPGAGKPQGAFTTPAHSDRTLGLTDTH
eukprot:GHVT01018155.1.p2 GENE.GHVT01018155.1~~GHVT01018155.1.p2  ORF type:complete len:231 (-),score=53.77 GHVT01018155.1:299-991(-)